MKKNYGAFLWVALMSILVFPLIVEAGGRPGASIVVQWIGVGEPMPLPAGVGAGVVADGTPCYAVPMYFAATKVRGGTGYDCIVDVGTVPVTGSGEVTTDYIFSFPFGNIVSRNTLTVQNALDQGTLDAGITNILGDFPAAGENTIQAGTRAFRNVSGNVRVSGGVTLNFLVNPPAISFDDLFVINLD